MDDDIKIPNLSKDLQQPYRDLIQDIEWTVGEYSFDYEVKLGDEVEDSFAEIVIEIKDDFYKDDKVKYVLEFRIYATQRTTIHRYEDVWDEETRENIWANLFFQADRRG